MVAVVRVAIWCILVVLLSRTEADPDLWGHVQGGRDIVDAGGVLRDDPYSFTSDRPWTNHNWLGEVALYGAWHFAGTPGLTLLKLVLALALLAVVADAVGRGGVPGPFAELLLFLWVAGVFATTRTVRPQLFSLLFFALVLRLLQSACVAPSRVLVLVPLMALWANVHGGWVVGAGTVALWAALSVAGAMYVPSRRAAAAVATVALIATLATPYGVELWRFLGETVIVGRPDIGEWRSVLDAGPGRTTIWAIVTLTAVGAVLAARPRPSAFSILVSGGLVVAAFRSARLGSFAATAVVVLLSEPLGRLLSKRPQPAHPAPGRPRPHAAALGIAAAAVAGLLVWRNLQCLPVSGPWQPDIDAASFIAANHLRGRMVTWFDWGQYAMWHFGPGLQVSMDGRRETVYSDTTLKAHYALYADADGASAYLAQLNADWVWLPTDAPVVARLRPPVWHVVFRSPRSLIAARTPAPPLTTPQSHQAMRCFPADPLTSAGGIC